MVIGFLALTGLTIIVAVLSGAAVYRPRDEHRPETLAIKPFWTNWVAFFASLAMGALIGSVLGSVGYTIVTIIANDAGAAEYWSYIVFGILFLLSLVFGAISTWRNAFPETTVAVGHGGVAKFLKTRIYSFYLKEGSHRLLWLFSSQDVDMTLQIGEPLDFEEPAKDHALVGVSLFWEYRIDRPARSLSTGSIKDKISPTFNKLSKTGVRDYVHKHFTEDLLKEPPPAIPPEERHHHQLQRDIKAELLQFSRSFIDLGSLKLKVEEIKPPKADVEAAGLEQAAKREVKRKKILIEGFNDRLQLLREDNKDLSQEAVAIMLQAQEGTLARRSFIFENLEGSVDKFTAGVGTILRKMAEELAEGAEAKGDKA